jgi:hypothetical protein
MSYKSFKKLYRLLYSDLKPHAKCTRADAIHPKTKLLVALRFFAGASYLDLVRIHGIGKTTCYSSCIKKVIQSIHKNKEIGQPKWPEQTPDLESHARAWTDISGVPGRRGVLQGCVGAIDGLLIKTKCPGKQETNKPRDYKSGHYKRYGLNAQVVCDRKLRIIFASIMCPGKTNDVNAYRHSKISDLIEALPAGYFVVGDNAYVNSDHLLVPYPGENIPDDEDAFNFFLSQLRIRVENTFAQLVAKWGVLWRPLNCPLRNQSHLVLCLCKLHNFCIDEKEPRVGAGNLTTEGLEVPSHAQVGDDGQLVLGSDWATTFQFQPSVDESDLRDQLKNHVRNDNLRRPTESLPTTWYSNSNNI